MILPLLLSTLVAAPPNTAEGEVRHAIQAQVAAWNRGDLAGFCSVYADDALFLSPSGVTRGRAKVEARYRKKYGKNTKTMGKLGIEPIEVRVMGGAVSVAAEWKLEFGDGRKSSGHTLIVFRRKPKGGWELVQDASM